MKTSARLAIVERKLSELAEALKIIRRNLWQSRKDSEAAKLRKELLQNEKSGIAKNHQ